MTPPSPFMKPPPGASTCPHCDAGAAPADGAQVCPSCRGAFTLRAGVLLDPSVQPPPVDPGLPHIKVKSGGVVTMKMGVVDPYGVAEGTLDPVIGMIPLDKAGVAYSDIYTVAVWRRISVIPLVVAALFVLPLAALCIYMAVPKEPGFLVLGLPLDLILIYTFYKCVVLKAHFARIVGRGRTVTVRFDSPMWRRRRFHDELLRRAGISPSPIP